MEARSANRQVEPLLEREEQLRELKEVLAQAERGCGGLALIEGAAGIGKSSLLAHARRAAGEAGFLPLHATGDDLERSFSFGVVTHLLAEPVRREAPLKPERFSGAAELAMPLLDGRSPLPSDAEPAFRLLHGLHWLVAGLAESSPLLLAIDDAHWADLSSLRFLLYLARRIEALPVAVMLTVRTGERLEPEVHDALDRLRAQATIAAVEPPPLSSDSVDALVARELPDADPALGPAFQEATGGNPFLLRELLAAAREGNGVEPAQVDRLRPDGVRASILARLRRIGPAAGRLASAAAILGPAASPAAVAKLAELDGASAAAATDALLAAQLFRRGDGLAFEHPIVREIVYSDIPPAARRRMHTQAARLLRETGCSVDEIASQVLLGERTEDEWVARVLFDAADSMLRRGDPSAAARALRRAHDERGQSDKPALLVALGKAELLAREEHAIERLESARAAARRPREQVEAAAVLARARMIVGDSHGSFEAICDALQRIPPGAGGAAEAELIVWLLFSGRTTPALVDQTAALLRAPRVGPGPIPAPAEIARRSLRALDALIRGDRGAASEELDWVLGQGGARPERAPIEARVLIGACLWRLGRYRKAQALLDRDMEEARRRGDLFELAPCLEGRIGLGWARGDVNGCLADIETMLTIDEEGWAQTAWVRAIAVEMLLERDEPDAAENVLAPAEGAESRLPDTLSWAWLPYGRALLALRAGRWEEAREQALAAGHRLLEVQVPSPDYLPWRSLAGRAAARGGDAAAGESLAAEEVELARDVGSRQAVGIALSALGTIRGGEDGVGLLRQAVDELDRTEALLAPARARLELGMALRRARRPRDARRPLEEALDAARRVGSVHVADRALGELRSAGGRPRRLALTGVESLTPGQLRVARMAADGMSNREIAEALFVTRRTVETHLTQVYGKLEIGSREELPAALATGGS